MAKQIDYEKQAEDLQEEYEEAVRTGKDPSVDKYIKRYKGPNKEAFREELIIAGVLITAGTARRERKSELEETARLLKIKREN